MTNEESIARYYKERCEQLENRQEIVLGVVFFVWMLLMLYMGCLYDFLQ